VQLFDLGVYLCVWGAVGGYALGLLAIDGDAESNRERDACVDDGTGAEAIARSSRKDGRR